MSVIASYGSRLSGAASGIRSWARWVGNPGVPILRGLLAVALVLFSGPRTSQGAESNSPLPSLSQIEVTNLQQLLRTCLQIQEQLQATQLAVEQNRQEAKAAATQNVEVLSEGLKGLQETLSAQRAREFEAWQRSNKALLIVAGAFAAIGFLAMLIMTYFQWRTSTTLANISTALPRSRGLGPASDVAALGPGDWRLAPSDQTAQSNLHLLGALEQLDKRIHEFKRAISSDGNGDLTVAPDRVSAVSGSEPAQANKHARVSVLLQQAHSLVNLDNAEAAVACFDQVLALDPNHPEALVKKGAALERLHKLNEAIECYDRAIAVDSSMTTAYLHKGGLCNRLERFKDALQCYEKALRTHDQWGG